MMQWNTLNIGNIKNNKILHINKKVLENKNPGSFFQKEGVMYYDLDIICIRL